MRTKFTLFLLFINFALFYTIFYLRTEQNGVAADPNLVLGPESSNLVGVTIQTEGGATLGLNLREDQWVITQPTAWTANEFAIRFILNELNSLRAETTFPVADLAASGQSLADYGLEKPRITLKLVAAGRESEPLTLQIGDATQGGNRLYVLSTDGKRIHVVSRSLAERLSLGLTDLRAEALFQIPVFEAQALTIESGQGQLTLLRRDGERWNIETLQARANRVDTELALGALTGLKLVNFVEAPIAAGLASLFATPELRVTLEGNGRRQTLLLGSPVPRTPENTTEEGQTLYLARMEGDANREATVFTVALPDTLLNTLKRAQRDLREKRLLDVDMQRVSTLSIQGPEGEITIQRLDSSGEAEQRPVWQLVTRKEDQSVTNTPAESAFVERLLGDLARLSAEEFTNDAPSQAERENYGFTRPVRRITLGLAPLANGTTPPPVVLLIGSGADHRTYANLANREPVFRVSSEILNQTPTQPFAFQNRTIHEIPEGAKVSRLSLQDLATTTPIVDFAAVETALPAEIEALLKQLRRVHAESLVGAFTPTGPWLEGQETPWAYRLEATFSLAGQANESQNLTLLLAPRTGGTTWLAGSPVANLNFTLEPDFVEALFKLTHRATDPGQPDLPAPLPTPAPSPAATPTP